MLARWDTFFYYTIATDGYSWDAAAFRHYNVVFFPLYPVLMRWGGAALGGHPLVAGLIISLVAYAGALVLLYRLALLELGDDYAWRVILLISTFPYALYFSAVYTESLFLLLTVGAFYAMRRGRLGWAALCGLAAGLTRPNGFWLALPLALLAVRPPDRDLSDASPRRPISLPLALLVACVPA
jgi:Gpi18-like mannosyltransferase